MKFNRYPMRTFVVSFFAILLLSVAATAKDDQRTAFPNVNIKNFGQMDERFYRGAEPKKLEDFQALKGLGINTVIDLQAKPEASERGMVESVGMRYVNIPMVEKKYPTAEATEMFLKTVNDPATWTKPVVRLDRYAEVASLIGSERRQFNADVSEVPRTTQ